MLHLSVLPKLVGLSVTLFHFNSLIAGVPAREYSEKVVELFVLTTNKLNEVCLEILFNMFALDVTSVHSYSRGLRERHDR